MELEGNSPTIVTERFVIRADLWYHEPWNVRPVELKRTGAWPSIPSVQTDAHPIKEEKPQ